LPLRKLLPSRRDKSRIYRKGLELAKKERKNWKDRTTTFAANLSKKTKRQTKCWMSRRRG